MCKIAILENYSLFCSGIKPVLEKIEEFNIVAEVRQVADLLPLFKTLSPDVLIIDIIHCEYDGIIPIKKIKRKSARTPILLVVNKDYSEYFEDYISLGVNGLVFSNSSPDELISAVRTLKNGDDYFPQKVWLLLKNYLRAKRKDFGPDKEPDGQLTNREISILRLFCKGYTYKEIGNTLNISPRTVETHKKNISTKINVRTTAEMVEFAINNNLN